MDLRAILTRIHESTPEQEIEMYDEALQENNWVLLEILIKRGILSMVKGNQFYDYWVLMPENIKHLYCQHYVDLITQKGGNLNIDKFINDILFEYIRIILKGNIEALYIGRYHQYFMSVFDPNILRVFHSDMCLSKINENLVFPNVVDLKYRYLYQKSVKGAKMFPNVVTLYIICTYRLQCLWHLDTLKNLTIHYDSPNGFYQMSVSFNKLRNIYPNMESLITHNILLSRDRISGLKYLYINYGDANIIDVDDVCLINSLAWGKCKKLTVLAKLLCGINKFTIRIRSPDRVYSGKYKTYYISTMKCESLNLLYNDDKEIDNIMHHLSRQVVCNNVVFTHQN